MKEWLLNHIVLIILIVIMLYLLAATLPYVRHKEVAESYKEGFDPRKCYGEEPGSERVAYVQDNIEAMIWRLKMIREANQEIIISTFEFSPDEAGIDMMAALLEAADKGVSIKILVDGTNAFLQLRGNGYFQAFVSHENIEINIYNAFNFLKPWNLQAMLHDKYVIIDKQMYLLGGRNTNNLFLGDYQEKKNIDREIYVYETKDDPGSSLYQLRDYFERIWELPENKIYQCKRETGKTAEAYQEIVNRIEVLREIYPEAYQETDWLAETVTSKKVTLLANPLEAENKAPEIWYCLHQLMLTGNEVTIHTPYIICGDEMNEDLEALCRETKAVKIVTNDVAGGANPWGCAEYLNRKEKIWNTGVRVYEYSAEHSMHTKTIIIDDRISVIGSYNLDMRSTYIDTEMMVVVDSEELNQMLKKEAEENISYSRTNMGGGEYDYGSKYVQKEIKGGKKVLYTILRVVVLPIRRFL